MRRKLKRFCEIEHLELRQLLSTIYSPAATGTPDAGVRRTIYVSANATGANDGSSWADAYTDMQTPLSVSPRNGEIWTIDVGQGTYYPTTGADRTISFHLENSVSVIGGYAGTGQSNPNARDPALYPTILSGDIGTRSDLDDNSYHVVVASGTGSGAALNGFRITAGNDNTSVNSYYGSYPTGYGAGLLDISGNATITNCTLSDNTANDWGGGIYIRSSSPTLTNCTFNDNYGGGMVNVLSSPTLTNCTFSGNRSLEGGGGIFNSNSSSPILTNCTISGNGALSTFGYGYGGGGGMENSNSSSPTLTNCTISGNAAGDWGGGMFNQYSSSPILTNCTISGNSAYSGGGGMYNRSSSPTLNNCTLSGNTVLEGGGGGMLNAYCSPMLVNCTLSRNTVFHNGGGMENLDSSPTLVNSTLTGNTATEAGDGTYNHYHSSPTLTNCILWGDSDGNEINNDSSSSVTITYSDIQGGYSGTGNIDLDPLFIRDPATNNANDPGDLHLQFVSPAIDAGSNAAIPTGITTDLDGDPRIFDFPGTNNGAGAVVDMGVYELGYNLDEVIVPAGQTLALPVGGYPFTANSLSIGDGGTLDIGDDTLTIQYPTGNDPASSIASLINSAYANGLWTGPGIISSDTFGQPANTTGTGYFDDGSQIKIGRTWYGDTNLSGQIDSDDLSLIMLGQTQHGTRWQDGNFNYDSQVNADDWMKLFYSLAVSKGQAAMNSVVSGSSVQMAGADGGDKATNQVALQTGDRTFAQGPIFSQADFDQLLDSPQLEM